MFKIRQMFTYSLDQSFGVRLYSIKLHSKLGKRDEIVGFASLSPAAKVCAMISVQDDYSSVPINVEL